MISQEQHQAYLNAHLAFSHYHASLNEIKEAYFAGKARDLPVCETCYPATICSCGHFDITWGDYRASFTCRHGHVPCLDTPGINKAILEECLEKKRYEMNIGSDRGLRAFPVPGQAQVAWHEIPFCECNNQVGPAGGVCKSCRGAIALPVVADGVPLVRLHRVIRNANGYVVHDPDLGPYT